MAAAENIWNAIKLLECISVTGLYTRGCTVPPTPPSHCHHASVCVCVWSYFTAPAFCTWHTAFTCGWKLSLVWSAAFGLKYCEEKRKIRHKTYRPALRSVTKMLQRASSKVLRGKSALLGGGGTITLDTKMCRALRVWACVCMILTFGSWVMIRSFFTGGNMMLHTFSHTEQQIG